MRKLFVALAVVALLLAAVPLLAQGSDGPGVTANRPVLTATGQPGSVRLEWTEPNHAAIVGYEVRRGTAPSQEDRWPLHDFPVPGTTYLDGNVTPGTTYYYEVIPLLPGGKKGLPSYEVATAAQAVPEGHKLIQFRMDEAEATVVTAAGEQSVPLKARPLLYHGRVMLAMDDAMALLGADMTYAADTGTITHRLPGGRVMTLAVGKSDLVFDKATREDVAGPVIRGGLVYLPLRWVAEAMQCRLTFSTFGETVLIEVR